MSKFKRSLKRAFETPRDRRMRKQKEYRMAVLRTIGTWFGVGAALTSMAINIAIFCKVFAK